MFSVKENHLESLVNQEYVFICQLGQMEVEVNHIIRNFAYHGAGRERCLGRLKAVNNSINSSQRKMEMMREALSEGIRRYRDTEKRICENAEADRFRYGAVNGNGVSTAGSSMGSMGARGNNKNRTLGDSLYSSIKAFLKYKEKFEKDKGAGLGGAVMSYAKDLQNFFNEKSGAEFFDLTKSSSKLWNAYYKYLLKNDDKGLLKKQWGKKAAGVSLAGSLMGLISTVCDVSGKENDTFFKRWGNLTDVLKDGTDVVKDGYELWHYEELLNNKNGLHSAAGKYAILAKTAFSVAGQTGRSIKKYNADGHWSADDTARTMTEISVAGLETMVSGLTFGIISADTFGTSTEKIATDIENTATGLGRWAGEYIAAHEDMRKRWKKGCKLEQVGLVYEAMFRNAFSAIGELVKRSI